MFRIVGPIVSWVSLFFFWLLLVGEWNRQELVAAAAAATIGTTAGELVRQHTRFRPALSRETLARSRSLPIQVLADFGLVVWALIRSSPRSGPRGGSFTTRDAPPEGLALAVWLADISPNAYVVEVDEDAGTVLMHDLIPRRSSEQPL